MTEDQIKADADKYAFLKSIVAGGGGVWFLRTTCIVNINEPDYEQYVEKDIDTAIENAMNKVNRFAP